MAENQGLNIFTREADRWYKILKKFSSPLIPVKKGSQKAVRLTFTNKWKSLKRKLIYLYGEEKGSETFQKIAKKMEVFIKKKRKKLKIRDAHFNPLNRFKESDVILITYPDFIQNNKEKTLKTLKKFSTKWLKKGINSIHLLPFYPYSSDRGFSVKNYKKVKENFGDWDDIQSLSENFNLMFDGVFSHMSSKSMWFKWFLKGSPLYENHFIAYDNKSAISKEDLKKIIRPRTSDLLSEFKSKNGNKYVWTTFSRDQVDLNYKEPRVILRIIDVIFRYAKNGATMIRLDAINYIWKELGTSCVNLKQTHVIIQLFRDILDIVAPCVSIVTETNVPHAKNISYLGNGKNEAQMIYNFTLPPLVLHTFYKGDVKYISRWADRLEKISKYSSYFNFLGSHDGIALRPAERVLPQREVRFMVKKAKQHGSLVQHRSHGEHDIKPYELNITWWSALNNENEDESEDVQIKRFIASHGLMLSLKGVPGVYLHSLFGRKNDYEAVKKTKNNRDINRENLSLKELEKELCGDSLASKVFKRMMKIINIRSHQKAFHPSSEQKILVKNDSVFSLLRTSIDKKEKILAVINVTNTEQNYTVNVREMGLNNARLYDIVNKKRLILFSGRLSVNEFDIALKPYEVIWLKSTFYT